MSESVSPISKADTTNPKDLVGDTKVSITKLPAVAIVHGAHAMMDGARKYGPYNWRAKKVVSHIYIDAAMRHLMAWFEGEELASDSKVHHLGHAIACCAILLDALETGNLVDDRPVDDTNRAGLSRVLDRLKKQIETGVQRPLPEPFPELKNFELPTPDCCINCTCPKCIATRNDLIPREMKYCNTEAMHHATCSCDECLAVRVPFAGADGD